MPHSSWHLLDQELSTFHTFHFDTRNAIEATNRMRVIRIVCGLVATSALFAADLSSYRGLRFGMSLTAAAKQTGTPPADARAVHQRPALLQELDWYPKTPVLADPKTDPVRDGVLCFFNGELYRIVVNYDRYRVEGMTAEDMIEAISATYGIAVRPSADITYHSMYGETAPVVARWENAEHSFNLVQVGGHSGFALVLYSKRLDALARTATTESLRLDADDAPQRELEKQQKRAADESLALEKARVVNKPNFRP